MFDSRVYTVTGTKYCILKAMYKIIVRSVCINVDCNVVTFLDVYLINYLIYLLRIVAAFAPTIFSGHKLWHTISSSIYKS